MPEPAAVITSIQRFSLDDGDGIRTTVFFKGCPLRCAWCHNPECISPQPELQFEASRCAGCNNCLSACPRGVFSVSRGERVIRRDKCVLCGICLRVCGQNALSIAGKTYTPGGVLREVLQDRNFYANSGGGVTLSGGEPFVQYGFVLELLKNLKKEGIHTAVDTCGCVPPAALLASAEYTDLYLLDIKTFSPELHREFTGMSNKKVSESLNILAKAGARVYVRIPLVAGINDSFEEIGAIAKLLTGNPCVALVELLAYHAFGTPKYAALGKVYQGTDFRAPARERLEQLAGLFRSAAIPVRIKAEG
jgi:pyruvate formate lyase activating enzyme